MKLTFREMQRAVHENSVKHGFWDGHVSSHDAGREFCDENGALSAYATGTSRPSRVLLHGGEENRLVPTKLALIHSEVSEALECYRNGEMAESDDDYCGPCRACGKDLIDHTLSGEGCRYVGGKPVGLPSELADVVIRVMDLAEALGVDLEGAIERKHAYNLTRPYKHGGKAI